MTAKDMFEKLGYILDKNPLEMVDYGKYCSDGCCRLSDIRFRKDKTIYIDTDLTLDLLQAINQQVKELGWNND